MISEKWIIKIDNSPLSSQQRERAFVTLTRISLTPLETNKLINIGIPCFSMTIDLFPPSATFNNILATIS